jgi:hypothetical protein
MRQRHAPLPKVRMSPWSVNPVLIDRLERHFKRAAGRVARGE